MRKQDLDLNISRLQTTGSLLWKTQKSLEELTESISDPALKRKSNEAKMTLDGLREIVKSVESFLWAQNAN